MRYTLVFIFFFSRLCFLRKNFMFTLHILQKTFIHFFPHLNSRRDSFSSYAEKKTNNWLVCSMDKLLWILRFSVAVSGMSDSYQQNILLVENLTFLQSFGSTLNLSMVCTLLFGGKSKVHNLTKRIECFKQVKKFKRINYHGFFSNFKNQFTSKDQFQTDTKKEESFLFICSMNFNMSWPFTLFESWNRKWKIILSKF